MRKNLFSCKGKVAVVTGGAGLIGKEIVKGLADFGAIVYLADINKRDLKGLLHSLNVKYIYLDVTSEGSIRKVFQNIKRAEGKIDILINCAYPKTKDWTAKFEVISFKSWKENVNNHLGGCFLCCQAAAEIMKKQKSGVIINFGSIYGIAAPDFEIYKGTKMTMPAAYSAIKGGMIAFTRYLATYYAKYNIRANVISPGGIYSGQNMSFVKNYCRKTPLGRMGRPADIVGAVIYLVSDASLYVTGHNLIVDGGWTVW